MQVAIDLPNSANAVDFPMDCGGNDVRYHSILRHDKSCRFALCPSYTNVDLRAIIDVTDGLVDVYVAASAIYFQIEYVSFIFVYIAFFRQSQKITADFGLPNKHTYIWTGQSFF